MPDNLTPEQRRRCMSRVRVKDTDIEVRLCRELYRHGLRYRKHVKTLRGTPDVVFLRARVAVFIDGDFWHGFQFRRWQDSLKPFWREKITKNRRRDLRAFTELRHAGWQVVRVWQHSIDSNLESAVARIIRIVEGRMQRPVVMHNAQEEPRTPGVL